MGASLCFLTNYKWFLAQNNLQKGLAWKKELKKNLLLCVENLLKDQKSIGLLLLQIQSVLCITIPQLLQIWKIKFEFVEPCFFFFFKPQYLAKKCQLLLVVGMRLTCGLEWNTPTSDQIPKKEAPLWHTDWRANYFRSASLTHSKGTHLKKLSVKWGD